MYLCLYFIFHYLPVDPYLLFAVVPYLRGQGEGKDENFLLCVLSPPYWICKPRRADWRRVAECIVENVLFSATVVKIRWLLWKSVVIYAVCVLQRENRLTQTQNVQDRDDSRGEGRQGAGGVQHWPSQVQDRGVRVCGKKTMLFWGGGLVALLQ